MFLTVKSVFYFIKTPQFLPILIFCCKYTAYIVLTGMIIIPVNMYNMYHRHTVHIYTHDHCILDRMLAFTEEDDEIQN